MVVGLWFAHEQTLVLRQKRVSALSEVDLKSVRDAEIGSQAKSLDERSFDVERVGKLLVSRDAIVDVVAAMEAEAVRHNITVRVPEIKEATYENGQRGTAAVMSGAQEDIEITVLAEGDAENIVDFSHSVEHLPYLTRLHSIFILTKQVDERVAGSDTPNQILVGQGTMDFILTVRADTKENE